VSFFRVFARLFPPPHQPSGPDLASPPCKLDERFSHLPCYFSFRFALSGPSEPLMVRLYRRSVSGLPPRPPKNRKKVSVGVTFPSIISSPLPSPPLGWEIIVDTQSVLLPLSSPASFPRRKETFFCAGRYLGLGQVCCPRCSQAASPSLETDSSVLIRWTRLGFPPPL